MSFCKRLSALLLLLFAACQQVVEHVPSDETVGSIEIYRPQYDLGPLFHQVQMAGLFPDSKTFVDARPNISLQDINEIYDQQRPTSDEELREFVYRHFEVPQPSTSLSIVRERPMHEHLNNLWSKLTRLPEAHNQVSTLLPLPYPYVVPGGRFREIYYWDSYFTMLGLLESGQDSLMLNMIRNFAGLIDNYGFIPNGNRSYYLGRSQPPFFAAMVMLWAEHKTMEQAVDFLPHIRKEYDFWMKGADHLEPDNPSHDRLMLLPDGTILNRYWDNFDEPRPESYREDYELAQEFPQEKRQQLYRDIRAGAESGWDYSSRWFSDGISLDSIITTQIIPVDLNCLLFFAESSIATLSEYVGDVRTAQAFKQKSELRANAIRKYFWDEQSGYFSDYHFAKASTTSQFSAAGMAPLFFNIATPEQAKFAADFLKKNLLHPGGIVSTTRDTGQQWDYPNGWAPQQWMAIQGLRNYQNFQLAEEITSRWLTVTSKVYRDTGKMMEKYNVVDLSLTAGGGEYPTQDGFGWTNGVTLALMSLSSQK